MGICSNTNSNSKMLVQDPWSMATTGGSGCAISWGSATVLASGYRLFVDADNFSCIVQLTLVGATAMGYATFWVRITWRWHGAQASGSKYGVLA